MGSSLIKKNGSRPITTTPRPRKYQKLPLDVATHINDFHANAPDFRYKGYRLSLGLRIDGLTAYRSKLRKNDKLFVSFYADKLTKGWLDVHGRRLKVDKNGWTQFIPIKANRNASYAHIEAAAIWVPVDRGYNVARDTILHAVRIRRETSYEKVYLVENVVWDASNGAEPPFTGHLPPKTGSSYDRKFANHREITIYKKDPRVLKIKVKPGYRTKLR